MVDLHTHIIWGVDDGAKSKQMTINMLKTSEVSGTKKIVATPHFLRGHFEVSLETIREKVEEINKLAKENNINIEVYPGQEVYYSSNIIEHYNDGLIGTINNTRYMLIEFPMRDFSISEIIDNLYELQIKGIVPVIAHPERYHKFIKEPKLVNKFINEGFLFQLNIGSITGDFGKEVKKTAEIFFENKLYSFIGSDAHGEERRTTKMDSGIEKLCNKDEKYMNYIKRVSNILLENGEIEFMGNKIEPKKKGLLSIFKR